MPKMAEREHHQSNDFAKKNVTLSRIVEISPSVFDSLEVEINQQSMMVVVDKSKHGTHFIKTKLLSVKLCCVCKHLFSG